MIIALTSVCRANGVQFLYLFSETNTKHYNLWTQYESDFDCLDGISSSALNLSGLRLVAPKIFIGFQLHLAFLPV